MGDEGLENALVGDVGEGGSPGAEAFFTLELRARLGGILLQCRRVRNATAIYTIWMLEKISILSVRKKKRPVCSHANLSYE